MNEAYQTTAITQLKPDELYEFSVLFYQFIQNVSSHSSCISPQRSVLPLPSMAYSPSVQLTVQATIEQVIAYIKQHYAEDLTLDSLSSQFYISKYHLMREFKKQTGMTIHSYLIHQRITHACNFLKQGILASNVSEMVGFSDYSLFYRAFVKFIGMTPKTFALSES